MESEEIRKTVVLRPDTNCPVLSSLLDNLNQYALKVHEHCLASSLLPQQRATPRKGDGHQDGVCRLCTATIDGIPVDSNKSSRTFGVELAEDAYEYHQRGGDKRPGNNFFQCVSGKKANNVSVKVTNNDKEIIEWFRKTHETYSRGKKKGATKTAPPFKARVTTAPSNKKKDIELDISLERVAERRPSRRVSFHDDVIKTPAPTPSPTTTSTAHPPSTISTGNSSSKSSSSNNKNNKPPLSWAKPALAQISNVLLSIANMFNCGQSCRCKPQKQQEQQQQHKKESGKSLPVAAAADGHDDGKNKESMTNLVVTVSGNDGEEKFVGLSSWDQGRASSVYVFLPDTANDIVEILQYKNRPSSSTYDYDSDQSTSKRAQEE